MGLSLFFLIPLYGQDIGEEPLEETDPTIEYEIDKDLVDLLEGFDVTVPPAVVKPKPTLACDGKWKDLHKDRPTCFPNAKNGTEARKMAKILLDSLKKEKKLEGYAKKLFHCDDVCTDFEKGCEKEVKSISTKILSVYKQEGIYCVKWRIIFKARCTVCVPKVDIKLVKSGSVLGGSKWISPNPASTFVRLKIKFKKDHKYVKFQLSDLSGKIVTQQHFRVEGMQGFETEFELGSMPSGVYIANLVFDDGYIETQKLVVK